MLQCNEEVSVNHKLYNFIVQKNQNNEDVLFYIDYECNNYMEEWSFENWGIKYWRNQEEA